MWVQKLALATNTAENIKNAISEILWDWKTIAAINENRFLINLHNSKNYEMSCGAFASFNIQNLIVQTMERNRTNLPIKEHIGFLRSWKYEEQHLNRTIPSSNLR